MSHIIPISPSHHSTIPGLGNGATWLEEKVARAGDQDEDMTRLWRHPRHVLLNQNSNLSPRTILIKKKYNHRITKLKDDRIHLWTFIHLQLFLESHFQSKYRRSGRGTVDPTGVRSRHDTPLAFFLTFPLFHTFHQLQVST